MQFELIAKAGRARRGRLTLERGVVETPAFMPVGTAGTVKAMMHESMQTTQPRHPLGPGPQHQMIGIAEDDVGAQIPHLVHIHRLDGTGSADRHESGRSDISARRLDHAATCGSIGCQ